MQRNYDLYQAKKVVDLSGIQKVEFDAALPSAAADAENH